MDFLTADFFEAEIVLIFLSLLGRDADFSVESGVDIDAIGR